MTNILVTGGAGFIGSHCCKALAAAGYIPVSYDNLVYGHSWAVKWGPLEIGDIGDGRRLDEVMQRYQPKAVIHLAAYAYVGESMREPMKYYENNVAGSISLLKSVVRNGVPSVVFSSSCATYGAPIHLPLSEAHPQAPINPYGRSKLMIESLLNDLDATGQLRSVSLRYFNAAGADPETEIGEVHDPETHLIPLALDVALGRRPAISIYGVDYDTPDGSCVRDYIHVSDLARAHVRALQWLLGGGETVALNLGTGEGVSVKCVIDTVQRITGREIPFTTCARRPGDPSMLIADAGSAGHMLDWHPTRSGIEQQISDAWKWHVKFYGEPEASL